MPEFRLVSKMIAYIFGYGSLVHPEDWVAQEMAGQPVYGFLDQHQRHFSVAFDNLSPEYDRKYYQEKGQRAPYLIGALALDPAPRFQVNGLAIPVDQRLLQRIITRERSYIISADLRPLFSVALTKPLLTFYPQEANRQLYRQGLNDGRLFMPQSYLDYCQQAFAAYGGQEDFQRLTAQLDYPRRDLRLYRQPGAI